MRPICLLGLAVLAVGCVDETTPDVPEQTSPQVCATTTLTTLADGKTHERKTAFEYDRYGSPIRQHDVAGGTTTHVWSYDPVYVRVAVSEQLDTADRRERWERQHDRGVVTSETHTVLAPTESFTTTERFEYKDGRIVKRDRIGPGTDRTVITTVFEDWSVLGHAWADTAVTTRGSVVTTRLTRRWGTPWDHMDDDLDGDGNFDRQTFREFDEQAREVEVLELSVPGAMRELERTIEWGEDNRPYRVVETRFTAGKATRTETTTTYETSCD